MAKRGEEEEEDAAIQVGAKGGRKSEEETNVGEIDPCDRGGWGKRAVLQAHWMLRRTKDKEGRRVQGRPKKGGNRTGMHGRMRRVTGYPTATLISRESECELSLESPLCLARPAIRIRGRRYPCRMDTSETGNGITVHYTSVICVYRDANGRTPRDRRLSLDDFHRETNERRSRLRNTFYTS